MLRPASSLIVLLAARLAASAAPAPYAGRPYTDAWHAGGPQHIPGPVFCAYYDIGGAGVAFFDEDPENLGSGRLNPADGTYLNEFRRGEGVDISYTKPLNDLESPCNRVTPPPALLYVGWTRPGEWFRLSVEAAEAGDFVADLLYTAKRGGSIQVEHEGQVAECSLESTFDPAETIPWRQWHHWSVARDAVRLHLPRGTSVLTVRILTNGEMNLATLLFRPAGTPRPEPGITTVTTPSPPHVTAWDGGPANRGAGWTNNNHHGEVSLQPKPGAGPDGAAALELTCRGRQWLGAGWNWTAFTRGTGTDVRSLRHFSFWIKCVGQGGDLLVNLLCGGQEFDTPEHHTGKVSLLKYCPSLLDGQWHRVVVPLADLPTVSGFDPSKVAEIQIGVPAPAPVDCRYYLAQLAFDAEAD